MRNKNILDNILAKYKAQPVGWGYVDIIVKREFVEDFIFDILSEEYNIIAVGWWEYCKTMDTKSQLGMGGPKSKFYEGWFSEICCDYPYNIHLTGNIVEKHKMVIEHLKKFKFGENITFENTETLTPSFNIDVPDDWRNTIKQ